MSDARLEAFVEATATTFETMLGFTPQLVRLDNGKGVTRGYDVSGIIGLFSLGDVEEGSLLLSFPEDVARRAVGRILDTEEFPVLDQDVADGIGELVNVIAGQARRGLAKLGIRECTATLPSVILGSQHRIFHQREAERFAAVFKGEIGTFLVQILLFAPKAARPGAVATAGNKATE